VTSSSSSQHAEALVGTKPFLFHAKLAVTLGSLLAIARLVSSVLPSTSVLVRIAKPGGSIRPGRVAAGSDG
jgi:hypothetical protein